MLSSEYCESFNNTYLEERGGCFWKLGLSEPLSVLLFQVKDIAYCFVSLIFLGHLVKIHAVNISYKFLLKVSVRVLLWQYLAQVVFSLNKKHSLRKTCQNTGFLWPALSRIRTESTILWSLFSHKRTESTILSLYGRIQINKRNQSPIKIKYLEIFDTFR